MRVPALYASFSRRPERIRVVASDFDRSAVWVSKSHITGFLPFMVCPRARAYQGRQLVGAGQPGAVAVPFGWDTDRQPDGATGAAAWWWGATGARRAAGVTGGS